MTENTSTCSYIILKAVFLMKCSLSVPFDNPTHILYAWLSTWLSWW